MTDFSGASAAGPASTALLTDRYELTMLRSALASGAAERRTVFEMFARHLPGGRRYGVVAGTTRFLDALERFRFDTPVLDFLSREQVVDEATLEWLAGYEFRGDIWGYPEGDCYLPGSPILVVEATFAEAVLLETLALSIFNHDCAVATAASRMVTAAGQRPLIEMGSRRTHEQAAVAAARAAYIAGFASTSNLAAGQAHGVPTAGTSAHAFTLLHGTEREAFAAQLSALGPGTTLLVDTYDVTAATRIGIELAGTELGAVRIDSGDLSEQASQLRALLDAHGARDTRVVVTGDLDEHAIQALAVAPVDGYGVGTSVVTGSGAPTAALVYKLVARAEHAAPDAPLLPVAKRSVGKPTLGGRKWPVRRFDPDTRTATAEVVYAHEPEPAAFEEPRLVKLVDGGKVVHQESLDTARRRHAATRSALPPAARRMSRGEPAIPTIFENRTDTPEQRRT
ncbi:nicotinate phosphoribosyltransferase [Lipingzhangella sp. LS1_29]|uniref:Nicotinate phosphoribosyltransferase n=1 Tax=Lipingzhangella rawalii TaxID=2055835 RepID=A0ABU2H5C1_9ACTN|nr:nicotinate phosphoribosyltransferase [Lipingzhangella rawalii]MDS1270509.1 nicotinate phosphoribosyltransferase [Lipingzhangella rawalii]